jgi:hypothetical protein
MEGATLTGCLYQSIYIHYNLQPCLQFHDGKRLLGLKGYIPDWPTLEDYTYPLDHIDEQGPVPSDFKLTVNNILEHNHNWETYVFHYGHRVPDHARKAVDAMLSCGDTFRASATYLCSHCSTLVTFPFTCHSRICSRCGKKYAKKFGDQLTESYYRVPHKHFIFTIPDYLYPIFRRGDPWEYMDAMLKASFETIEEIYRKRFPRGDGVVPGMISIIHPTGRALNFQPHIHMVLTGGGIDRRSGRWVDFPFIKLLVLTRIWQVKLCKRFKQVLDSSYPDGRDMSYWKARALLDRAINQKMKYKYTERKGLMVKIVKYDRSSSIPIEKMGSLGTYLARYIRHPPIGNSRLLGYDGGRVEFKREWDGKETKVTMPLSRMFDAIVWNIPPPHFRVIRYRGLYAPVVRKKYSGRISRVEMYNRMRVKLKKGQKRLEYGPFCKECKGGLEFISGHYTRIDGVVRCYGL